MAVKYEDLEIELSRCCCGQPEVRILESPVDRPRARLEVGAERLQALWQSIDRYDEMILDSSPGGPARRRELARGIGRDLFDLLTPGRVGSSLRQALSLLDQERQLEDVALRLRFSFGAAEHFDPDLANLPWELINDPQGGGRFLGGEPQTQVVRYLDVTRKIRPLLVEPPLRVLAVLSSPSSQPRVDLDAQELRLLRVIRQNPGKIELDRLLPATLEALQATLAEHETRGQPIHVLHFLGHGELTGEGDGALYFERKDGSEHIVRGRTLATQLSAFRHLRLVVLASCGGAKLPRQAGRNPFTGSASALVAANLPAVVAMQFTVSEAAAAAFTYGFYVQLGTGSSVEEAVAQGRLSISAEDTEGTEWATPVLFLRPADGRVLELRQGAEDRPQEGVSVRIRAGDIRAGRNLVIAGEQRGSAAEPSTGPVKVDVKAKKRIATKKDLVIGGVTEK